MSRRLCGIQDVVALQMCCGCGACAAVEPERFEMIDALDHGRRPRLRAGAPAGNGTGDAMRVCPGVGLAHSFDARDPALISELTAGWGPVCALWEGYASDPELRYAASSGGAASALALYCIDRERMHGVLHIRARHDVPFLNETVLSRTREELLAATGSRYAPASPCDRLSEIEGAPAPCVFIGKPCDVAAAQKARTLRPRLDARLGLTIGIFCAGTPSTRGTLEMLRRMGVTDPMTVSDLRYRGLGWPGRARATFRNAGEVRTGSLSYDESWGGILQRHRQWRCYVCADHTGEFSDVAVGDPWYRPIPADEPGRSLILARSAKGRRIVEAAIAAGYLSAEVVAPSVLVASQPNLLRTRGAVWARIWVTRLLGAAVPRYRRLPMFRFWWTTLGARAKLQSILGSVKRVFTKKLRRRATCEAYTAEDRLGGTAHPPTSE